MINTTGYVTNQLHLSYKNLTFELGRIVVK